ncbi:hypothetical protein LC724_22360 [Blautia sp. RD014234]|nr:hypothetical protein [Blautia parvula]
MFRLLKDKAISLKLKSKLILSFMLTSVFILLLFALFFTAIHPPRFCSSQKKPRSVLCPSLRSI